MVHHLYMILIAKLLTSLGKQTTRPCLGKSYKSTRPCSRSKGWGVARDVVGRAAPAAHGTGDACRFDRLDVSPRPGSASAVRMQDKLSSSIAGQRADGPLEHGLVELLVQHVACRVDHDRAVIATQSYQLAKRTS